MNRFMIALGLLLLATGCQTYEAKPLDPKAELAALGRIDVKALKLEHARPGEAPESPPPKLDLSGDLGENELVAVALTINPTLRAKRFGSTEARSRLVTAGLWPNPVFAIAYQPGVSGAPGFQVSAAWLLEVVRVWDRYARIDAATATVVESEADIVAAEWAVVGEVRVRRWGVLVAEQTVAILKEEVELRRRALEVITKAKALGEVRALELTLSELEVAEVERDLRRAQTELDTARRELNRAIGLSPETELPLARPTLPVAIKVYDDVPDDELERRVLGGRFELRAKEAAYQRSEKEHQIAVYRQYPPLAVGPSMQRQPEGTNYVGPAFLVELPIFNQNQGEIAESEAARERTRIEYVSLLHRLKADAYEARGFLRRAKLEVEAQQKDVLPLVEKSQKLLEEALKLREIGTLDWITAQRRALQARREYVDSLLRYQEAVIRVEVATGMSLARPPTPR